MQITPPQSSLQYLEVEDGYKRRWYFISKYAAWLSIALTAAAGLMVGFTVGIILAAI